jgi:hypothetical protein
VAWIVAPRGAGTATIHERARGSRHIIPEDPSDGEWLVSPRSMGISRFNGTIARTEERHLTEFRLAFATRLAYSGDGTGSCPDSR